MCVPCGHLAAPEFFPPRIAGDNFKPRTLRRIVIPTRIVWMDIEGTGGCKWVVPCRKHQ